MQNHDELTRRRFLGRSAAAGLTFSLAPAARAASANERIGLGIVGVRRRGLELAEGFARLPGAEVRGIGDVDDRVRSLALKKLGAVQAKVPRAVSDARVLFDDPEIDAIVIATPDHLHVPLTIAACEAGKDVYLEVPVTHQDAETEPLLTAVERSGTVVQCGLQQRSGEHFRSAIEYVQSGKLGRVPLARAWAVHRRSSRAVTATRPGDPSGQHHTWRWFWETGTGELGQWGVHLLDVACWGLQVSRPRTVTAQGHLLDTNTPFETPDTLSVQYQFDDCTVVWEHRSWSDYGMEGRSAGVAFYGELGTLVVDRGGWKVYGSADGQSAPATPLLQPHLNAFLNAVRSRSVTVAPIETGCAASTLCHLGNAAYRTSLTHPTILPDHCGGV